MNQTDQDFCIFMLDSILSLGREQSCDVLSKKGFTPTHAQNQITIEITNALIHIDKSLLFTNPNFAYSLRIAALSSMTNAGQEWESRFRSELETIFSGSLAEQLWNHETKRIKNAFLRKEGLVPSKEETSRHHQWREAILREVESSDNTFSDSKQLHHPGTKSWTETCPDCKTQRRCDENTKWFRCKCGKRKYPFENPIIS